MPPKTTIVTAKKSTAVTASTAAAAADAALVLAVDTAYTAAHALFNELVTFLKVAAWPGILKRENGQDDDESEDDLSQYGGQFSPGEADVSDWGASSEETGSDDPLDRLAIVGAAAAFEDREYFQNTCKLVIDSREKLVAQLQAKGFEVLPSAANFIFARHPRHDAAGLAAKVREQGVIVRHFKQERIAQFLRISIGTPEQNQALIDALGEL